MSRKSKNIWDRNVSEAPDFELPSSYFDDEEDELPVNYRRATRSSKPATPHADKYFAKIKQQSPDIAPNSALSTLDRIAIATIIFMMSFWTLVILWIAFIAGNGNTFLGVVFIMSATWIITWIAYYIGWRYYWIMLALNWLLATGYMLTIFGVFQQTFMVLFGKPHG